jgi:hypothetical protein
MMEKDTPKEAEVSSNQAAKATIADGKITFLTEDITFDEIQKLSTLVLTARKMVEEYFGVKTTFDILICKGRWEMEVQVMSRREGRRGPINGNRRSSTNLRGEYYDLAGSVGITDYRLEEIIIRYDIAKFGHYLHEMIHAVISKEYPQQLREGLAWYFTLKLTEKHRYVRPQYPTWVDRLYISPVRKLAQILGDDDFLRDFAVGRASLEEEGIKDEEIQDMFLPAELFYSKKQKQRE